MSTVSVSLAPVRVGVLRRRIRWIVAATIAYNVIEAVVAIAAGSVASSTALIGFENRLDRRGPVGSGRRVAVRRA